jgi:hypothetical protein
VPILTQRDRSILRFIENFGGITIYQCSKVFFTDAKHGYELARKRLKKMYEMKLVKFYTNNLTNERVYCTDTKMTPHNIYLVDLYAAFIQQGASILDYNFHQPTWLDGKYRSDGFLKVQYNGKKRIYCVEVDVTHSTNMQKYEEIYTSNEIQNRYGGFPMIIIIGETINQYSSENFDIAYLGYKLEGFIEKVLALA